MSWCIFFFQLYKKELKVEKLREYSDNIVEEWKKGKMIVYEGEWDRK